MFSDGYAILRWFTRIGSRIQSATAASFRLSTYRFHIPRKLKWPNLTQAELFQAKTARY